MSFYNQTLECLPRIQLQDLQILRLRQTVAQAGQAAYYRQIFQDRKITPDLINSLSDVNLLPFTTKDDLRSGSPEDFLAVPLEKVVRLHASSGTTGTPTAVYHTQDDLDNWTELVARCLVMVGMTPSDVFQNMVGYGLFTGGLGLHYGAEKMGAAVIPAGTGNSRRQINLMKQFKTTAIHIIPSYALKLLDTMAELGVDPARDLSLRLAVIGAEPHTQAARQRIEYGLGVKAFNCYGLSEMNGPGVAFECRSQTGLHLWEDSFLLEILDPTTLQPLPDGQVGEVVLTTLCRQAMPLIRYRTKDLARILPDECACGRTHRRLSRILGRTDDMLILKGVNIFPMQIERVLMAQSETGGNYLIIVDKEGPIDTMTVRAEMSKALWDSGPGAVAKLERKIERLLRDEILISPKVELVPTGALKAAEGKAVRVLDNRPRISEE